MTTQQILGAGLAVQVALAALTWWPRDTAVTEPQPLVAGGGNALTHVEIVGHGDDARPVVLDQQDGAWVLTSEHGYPADPEKVGEVLDALGGIQLRAPVATQAVSHEALKVSDDTWEKKITFTADGATRTVFVGAAASKAIHLREEGADAVYKAKGLSAWTFKDTARGFLPANHADLEVADLASLRVRNSHGDIAFAKVDGAWTVEGDPTRVPVQTTLDGLLDKVAKVRLDSVVGTEVTADQGLLDPAVRVEWATTEGDQTVPGGLVVGAEDDGKFFLKTDASPFVILSPSYRIKDLVDADPAALTTAAPEPTPEPAPTP
ncbi:MAG: DUF4340 domain-containing protein [Alphaproteobacteria bacterium]|nr:DUF4340 domain-containing protein [Alphaproteobacteria bacterium]